MTVPHAFLSRPMRVGGVHASACAVGALCACVALLPTSPSQAAPPEAAVPIQAPAGNSQAASPPARSDLELKAIAGLLRAGRYLEAERAAQTHLADIEHLYGAESLEAALVLDKLAEALRLGGKSGTPEALRVCTRAIAIKERRLSPDDPEFAVSLHNLGALHLNNGAFEKARPILERVLQIRHQAFGENHIDVARSLLYLANLELLTGADAKAEADIKRAIAIHNRVLSTGDPERARALNMLGTIAYNRGDFATTDSLMDLTLTVQTTAFGETHPLVAETLQNLGSLRGEMGDYGEAESYLRRALEIRRNTLGPNHALVAFTLMSLGRIHEAQGHLDVAARRYREALRIQDMVAPHHPDAGWIRARLGRLAVLQGKTNQGRRFLEQALKIQVETLGNDHPDVAWTLLDLSRAQVGEGEGTAALESNARAIAIQEKALGRNHPDVAQALALRAELLAANGDTLQAMEAALEAAHTRTDHLLLTAAGFSERQALAYAAVRPSPLAVALTLVARHSSMSDTAGVARTWDALLRSRTVVLDEMAARYRAAFAAVGDSSLASALAELRRAGQRYANLLVHGEGNADPSRYPALLAWARSDLERAEKAIGSRSSAWKSRDARLRVHLLDVRRALPAGWGIAAFAEYNASTRPPAPAPRRILAMVMRPSGEVSVVDLGPSKPIEAAIRRWTATIESAPSTESKDAGKRSEAACRAAGAALRSLIWDPVRTRLGDINGVFIIPDGPISRVPFGGLPDPQGGYLVERGPLLHYVSSERDIASDREGDAHGQGLLALGDPAFGGTPTASPERGARRGVSPGSDGNDCVEFDRIRFRPLPETLTEVREIARSWAGRKDVLVLTGEQAREGAFKALAPGREVVHIATHGFFLDTNGCVPWGPQGTRGISVIAPAGKGSAPRARPRPLLLSGLALTGANRRDEAGPDDEDGILTADEVASVNLRGVSWVVLSACDTGLGRLQGSEGVLGLRRAFTIAGAGTLVMSLWGIEDSSAREWMEHLYSERFEKGLPTARAVREASRDVLRERRAQSRSTHPFYWAAFVAVGDWR